MNNILFVEDDEHFRDGGRGYMGSRSDVRVMYVPDYATASKMLHLYENDGGVICDILFPKSVGTGDVSLGRETLARMGELDPNERRAQALMKKLGEYVELDAEMKSLVRVYARHSKSNGELISRAQRIAKLDSVPAATVALKNQLCETYGRYRGREDCFGALEEAMERSEENQPLCIPLAERATKLGIPFVIATSTDYSNPLTRTVFDYVEKMSGKGIDCTLVNCSRGFEEKKSHGFWKKVYNELRRSDRQMQEAARR